MHWGRANASGCLAVQGILMLLFFGFILQFQVAEAATFVVGDDKGWSFGVASWTDGKSFKAGDVLVFNYDPSAHNVVEVPSNGQDGCSVLDGSKMYSSGSDHIVLKPGRNYFICGIPGHCISGMKISVRALI